VQVLRQHVGQLLRRPVGVVRPNIARHRRQPRLDRGGAPAAAEQDHVPGVAVDLHGHDDQRLEDAALPHARRLG